MATSLGLTNNKTVDICIEDVKNIDNFEDVINRSLELDVDLGGLDSLEEMKERLVMELEKSQSGFVNFKTKILKSEFRFLKSCHLSKNIRHSSFHFTENSS